MKTSFYFVIWIIIYPLLGLLHNPWIDNNSFIVALIIVWGLSYLINRALPDTINYERALERNTILEEVYSGDVATFRNRLSRQTFINFMFSIYLGVSFVFILFSMMKGNADDWIALFIFGFFSFASISRAFSLNKLVKSIDADPTPQKCIEIAETSMNLDYSSYYQTRLSHPYEALLPAKPCHFTAFQITSLIFSGICLILGLITLVMAIIMLVGNLNPRGISAGIMYFIYGSLATYFGLSDLVSGIRLIKKKSN